MDETRRTARTYEANADPYAEKYRSGSVAARDGDPFFDALGASSRASAPTTAR